MTRVRVHLVDAFTACRFAGNPAGVILDADGCPEASLRALARELCAGDTAVVLRPEAADHDLRVRFLTPRGEAPFVGHATLAVHGLLAALGEPPRPRQRSAAGLVRVERRTGGAVPRIALTLAPPALLQAPDAARLAELLAALSLTAADLDPRCPPMLAGRSGTRLLIGLADGATLARLQPDSARLSSLVPALGAPGVFLFTLQPTVAGAWTEARMFCPALGIPEDPVSGQAHALLASYLAARDLLPAAADGQIRFIGAQGHHVGRPGRVAVELRLAASALQAVTLVGETAVALASTVEL